MGLIYKIVCLANGKQYVGQTKLSEKKKWDSYRYGATSHKKNRTSCRAILDAMVHYGIENFSFEVIEECEDDLLSVREMFWISELNTNLRKGGNGYNLTDGGQEATAGRSQVGRPHTKETKKKISEAHKGRKFSTVHRSNISRSKKGQVRKQTDAERAKRKLTLRPYMHSVICLDSDGVERKFDSIKQAVLFLNSIGFKNANGSHIRGCLKGQRFKAYGFSWCEGSRM